MTTNGDFIASHEANPTRMQRQDQFRVGVSVSSNGGERGKFWTGRKFQRLLPYASNIAQSLRSISIKVRETRRVRVEQSGMTRYRITACNRALIGRELYTLRSHLHTIVRNAHRSSSLLGRRSFRFARTSSNSR